MAPYPPPQEMFTKAKLPVAPAAKPPTSTNTRDGKMAYVTFLAGDGDYVKGVVGLAKGLRKVRSAYPLLVAVLPDVPEQHKEMLLAQGCVVKEIEPVHPPEHQTQFAMAYYVINYSKLQLWGFDEYSRLVYLDADVQVYANIDDLFALPRGHLYAVMDCFCEPTWSHSPQYRINYCQQRPGDVCKWKQEEMGGPPPSLYFNAGVLVLEPGNDTRLSLLQKVRDTPPTPFAEQDFLNMFFKDVYRPIPNHYNLVMAMLWRHPENVDLKKIKVVHYCAAGSKPWRYTGKEEHMDREDIKDLVAKWWDVYLDPSLDHIPDGDLLQEQGDREKDKLFRAALSRAGHVTYGAAPSAA